LNDRRRPAAWLSLDDNDNDVFVLTRNLAAAIRTAFPGACDDMIRLC